MDVNAFTEVLLSSPLFWWGTGLSVVMFLVVLPATAWVLVRLPADFFRRDRSSLIVRMKEGSWPVCIGLALKNLTAIVFLVAGVMMLVLPGQGVLAILVGLILLDFPGKRKLEYWIITRKAVLPTVNWLRRRFDRPELEVRREPDGYRDE